MAVPLVSVITLTYNNLEYIEDTLKSITKQDYPNIELIISDDASENFDEKVINEYLKYSKLKNVLINRNKKNIGTVKNFNLAIKKSSGKYIIPLSSGDVFYDGETVSSVVRTFEKQKSYVITGFRDVYDETLSKFIERLPKKEDIAYLNRDPLSLYIRLCKGNFISGACTSYSKEVFEKFGFFDENYRLLEDFPFYLKLSRNGVKINFIDKPLIKYRLGGISTSNLSFEYIHDLFKVVNMEIFKYKRDFKKYYDYKEAYFNYKKSFYDKNMISFSEFIRVCFCCFDVIFRKVIRKFNRITSSA